MSHTVNDLFNDDTPIEIEGEISSASAEETEVVSVNDTNEEKSSATVTPVTSVDTVTIPEIKKEAPKKEEPKKVVSTIPTIKALSDEEKLSKAISKLEEETATSCDSSLVQVKNFLYDFCNQKATCMFRGEEVLLSEIILYDFKKLESCMTYIMKKAMEYARSGKGQQGGVLVPDEVVFGWSLDYYSLDDEEEYLKRANIKSSISKSSKISPKASDRKKAEKTEKKSTSKTEPKKEEKAEPKLAQIDLFQEFALD